MTRRWIPGPSSESRIQKRGVPCGRASKSWHGVTPAANPPQETRPMRSPPGDTHLPNREPRLASQQRITRADKRPKSTEK